MQKFTAAISILFLASVSLHAAAIHVPADQPSIQAGLNAAAEFDTILVAHGIYYESIVWPEVYGLKLIGSGEEVTTIDGSGTHTVVRFSTCLGCESVDSETLFKGFTVQNGYAQEGGGIQFGRDNSPTVENVTIQDCISWKESWVFYGGGGVLSFSASPKFKNVTFRNNTAAGAGGAYHCDHSQPYFENTTFVGNNAQYGSVILCNGPTANPYFKNVTMYNNHGDAGIFTVNAGKGIVENSILWGSNPAINDSDGEVTATCSNIEGGHEGDNVINMDPRFCDTEQGDFHLWADSPCAPDNNDCGVLMGAWPVGCSTAVESRSWGQVKALY